jgi:hypothetical protein
MLRDCRGLIVPGRFPRVLPRHGLGERTLRRVDWVYPSSSLCDGLQVVNATGSNALITSAQSGRDMTTSTDVLPVDLDLDPGELCAACSHPMTAHDATGRRYCAATLSMARVRGCICKKTS